MKKCRCGFHYNNENDLEMVNLILTKGVIKYYCPDCKSYKMKKNIK